jgi:hypothetical protein
MNKKIYFTSIKTLKKEVGSGSISQRYGSGDLDPDPRQNVTDPQHCFFQLLRIIPVHFYSDPYPIRDVRAEKVRGRG